MSALAIVTANLIVGTRELARDPQLQDHPSREWFQRAASMLWQGLGYANEERVVLGLLESADGIVLDSWPADAQPVAIAYDRPIFAVERDGTRYYSGKFNTGKHFWSAEIDLAFALCCAEWGTVCTSEALSRLTT